MSEAPPTELPPYLIEGARSGRSKCKTCRRAISKGALRFGFLIEGPYGTGYLWHHMRCAARRHMDKLEEAYAQEAWLNAKEPPPKVPTLEDLQKHQEAAEEKRKKRKEIPYAEIDPSGRAKCKRCEQPMEKGSLRVVLGRGVYFGNQVRTAPINVHPGCVREEMAAGDCTTEAEGFAEALRANSEGVEAAVIDTLLAEIGELS
jgi:hypothetical protein